jgi:glutathione S-transferase
MRTRSRVLRLSSLLAAALQLASPSAAAWADARLDAESAGARPHIESHTTAACTRVHAADCALCSFLSAPLAAGRMALPELARRESRRAALPNPALAERAGERSHPQPRAPPTLS